MNMNKIVKWTSVLLIIFVFVLGAIQLQGNLALISPPAPPQITKLPPTQVIQNPKIVVRDGGIDFGECAKPSTDLDISSFSLTYDAAKQDGQRLVCEINGQKVASPVYDWQFIPAAYFAASDTFSVFSLFGRLYNEQLENLILEHNGRILNYHPFLQNTLMGLRMYQMDVLILWPESIHLPTEDGDYILGPGEVKPDTVQNKLGLANFYQFWNNVINEFGYEQRSWIISDFRSDIVFNTQSEKLNISGSPYFYMWRFKFDRADYNENEVRTQVDVLLNQMYNDWLQENASGTFEDWVIETTVSALRTYEDDFPELFGAPIPAILSLTTDHERADYLRQYTIDSLYENLLKDLYFVFDIYTVEPLWEYSDKISARTDLLEKINPQVWNATTTFMRYAAFFRYCRENFATEWDMFLRTLQMPCPSPAVTTPTALFSKDNTEINNYLLNNAPQPPLISTLPDIALYNDATHKIYLDQFVTDLDTKPEKYNWTVTHAGAAGAQNTLQPVLTYIIEDQKIPGKGLQNNPIPKREQTIKMGMQEANKLGKRAGNGCLQVSVDPTTHVATFMTTDCSQPMTYKVVFKVTDDTGLFDTDTLTVNVMTKVREQEMQPESFTLQQNYPNPFNSSTRLEFNIPERATVKASVYNMLGERVATLFDQTMNPGLHSYDWKVDASLATGAYVIELTAGTPTATRIKRVNVLYIR